MAEANIEKSSISILQELAVKMGLLVKYDWVQAQGEAHELSFTIKVTFGELVAIGTGARKQLAKHNAASVMLKKISESKGTETVPPEVIDIVSEIDNIQIRSPNADNIEGNPIGELKAFCGVKEIEDVQYKVIKEEGPAHDKFFEICATLREFSRTGSGKSKKIAKKEAAYKLWEVIQEIPDKDDILKMKPASEISAENPITNLLNLSLPRGHHITRLIESITAPAKPLELLQEIADEQRFKISFGELNPRPVFSKYTSFLELEIVKVYVFFGDGDSIEEARIDAAKHALKYIRQMCTN